LAKAKEKKMVEDYFRIVLVMSELRKNALNKRLVGGNIEI
jgi:hypothetical protein